GISVGVSAVPATFITGRAASTLNLGVVLCVAGVASLVGVTSISFLPTSVVFCLVSFAFVCLSLSCVVSRGFVATTFSSALVVVAEAGAPPEAFANFNSFSLSLLLTVVVAASVTDLPLLSSI